MISLKDVAYLSEDPRHRLTFKTYLEAAEAIRECDGLFSGRLFAESARQGDAMILRWRVAAVEDGMRKYLCMEGA